MKNPKFLWITKNTSIANIDSNRYRLPINNILSINQRFQNSKSFSTTTSKSQLDPSLFKFRKMSDIFFGTTTTLNRFSFLRSDSKFIDSLIKNPTAPTRLVFFKQFGKNSIHPVVHFHKEQINDESVKISDAKLFVLELNNLPEILREKFLNWSDKNAAHDSDIRKELTLVFLGMDENNLNDKIKFLSCGNELTLTVKTFTNTGDYSTKINTESKSQTQPETETQPETNPSNLDKYFQYQNYKGVPYFAVDLTHCKELEGYITNFNSKATQIDYLKSMPELLNLSNNEASIFSYSKTYLDWLMRNQFCPGCGSKVIPVDAGTKLLCTNFETIEQNDETDSSSSKLPPVPACPAKQTSVNNVCFPRSDPVIIVGIISSDGKKILLGNNRRHSFRDGKHKMYSCIAGFMEPGETIEEATIREIWEETGCKASDVKIMRSQPWPFPSSLMIGCLGVVEFNGSNEKINLTHDNELEECYWFDVEDIRRITKIEDLKSDIIDKEEYLKYVSLPTRKSIAFTLIDNVVNGNIKSIKDAHI